MAAEVAEVAVWGQGRGVGTVLVHLVVCPELAGLHLMIDHIPSYF